MLINNSADIFHRKNHRKSRILIFLFLSPKSVSGDTSNKGNFFSRKIYETTNANKKFYKSWNIVTV